MTTFRFTQSSLLAHKIRFGDLYGEEEQDEWVQEFFEEDGVIVTPSEGVPKGGPAQEGVIIHSTGEYVPMGSWLCRSPSGSYFGLSDSVLAELATPQ